MTEFSLYVYEKPPVKRNLETREATFKFLVHSILEEMWQNLSDKSSEFKGHWFIWQFFGFFFFFLFFFQTIPISSALFVGLQLFLLSFSASSVLVIRANLGKCSIVVLKQSRRYSEYKSYTVFHTGLLYFTYLSLSSTRSLSLWLIWFLTSPPMFLRASTLSWNFSMSLLRVCNKTL